MLALSVDKIVIFGFIFLVAFHREGIRFGASIVFPLVAIRISLNRIGRRCLFISTNRFCFNLSKEGFLTVEDGVVVHT